MEAQEAKLYQNGEYIKSLCLIGYNDDFDRITIGENGKMIVDTLEDYFDEESQEYQTHSVRYTDITEINFK